MPTPPTFAAYRCDVFIDAGPFSSERIGAAIDAGFPRIVVFAADEAEGRRIGDLFSRASADGVIAVETDGSTARLASILATETERCLIWLSPSDGGGDAAASGAEDDRSIDGAAFRRLLARIDAIGAGVRDDHAILVDDVRRLMRLPCDDDIGVSVDAVIERARRANPAYRVGFDDGAAERDILSFSIGLHQHDDFGTLSTVLTSEDALANAALRAMERMGSPITELAHHLPNHHARLAATSLAGGKPSLALTHAARAAALAPKVVGHFLLVCDAAEAGGYFDVLSDAAAAAAVLSMEDPPAHRYLSVAFEGLGRPDEAIAAASEALRLAGADFAPYALHLARLQRRLGDPAAAESTLRRAVAAAPVDVALSRALSELLDATAPRASDEPTVDAAIEPMVSEADAPVDPAPEAEEPKSAEPATPPAAPSAPTISPAPSVDVATAVEPIETTSLAAAAEISAEVPTQASAEGAAAASAPAPNPAPNPAPEPALRRAGAFELDEVALDRLVAASRMAMKPSAAAAAGSTSAAPAASAARPATSLSGSFTINFGDVAEESERSEPASAAERKDEPAVAVEADEAGAAPDAASASGEDALQTARRALSRVLSETEPGPSIQRKGVALSVVSSQDETPAIGAAVKQAPDEQSAIDAAIKAVGRALQRDLETEMDKVAERD